MAESEELGIQERILEKKIYVEKIIANAKNKESRRLTTDLVKEKGLQQIYQMVSVIQ